MKIHATGDHTTIQVPYERASNSKSNGIKKVKNVKKYTYAVIAGVVDFLNTTHFLRITFTPSSIQSRTSRMFYEVRLVDSNIRRIAGSTEIARKFRNLARVRLNINTYG